MRIHFNTFVHAIASSRHCDRRRPFCTRLRWMCVRIKSTSFVRFHWGGERELPKKNSMRKLILCWIFENAFALKSIQIKRHLRYTATLMRVYNSIRFYTKTECIKLDNNDVQWNKSGHWRENTKKNENKLNWEREREIGMERRKRKRERNENTFCKSLW